MTRTAGHAEAADSRERSTALAASSLHQIHRLVQERGGGTIALHVGEPHIRMPGPVAEAFARAIRDDQTRYTDAPGLPALRDAIAEHLADNGAPDPGHIFVTPGSCQAIAAVLQSMSADGAIAFLPEIHWPMHLQQVLLAGFRPRFLPMTPEALEDAYEPHVRVIIVNSPANPTGEVADDGTLAAIHAWAVRHRVLVISDEAYEDFVYEGTAPRLAAFDSALPEDERVVFSVHTFSKGFSMTGCRLGYVAAPSARRAELLCRVQEAVLIAPCTPVQYAGLAALRQRSHLPRHHDYVRATRDEVIPLLDRAGLLWASPAGGWYALLDLSSRAGDSGVFVLDLLDQAGVALAPGHGFLPAGHPLARRVARLTLCAERETTVEGVRRLLAFGQES
jgi:aspartate aminotransferase